MSEKKKKAAVGRRDFFKKAGLGAGAASAVAVGLAGRKAGAAAPSPGTANSAGYRESPHVKKYYELARF